jgi:hypothetical protein
MGTCARALPTPANASTAASATQRKVILVPLPVSIPLRPAADSPRL